MDAAWYHMRDAHLTLSGLAAKYAKTDLARSREFIKAQKLVESEMALQHPAIWGIYRNLNPKLPNFAEND